MTALAILGVDPGLSGALALYGSESLTIFDMPTVERKVGGKTKRQIDAYQLGNWLDLHRNVILFTVIEDVHSMPAQGITSAFNFGFSTGVLHGAICANQIPLKLVAPVVWKRHFGLIGQDKDASRLAASRVSPRYSHHWPLKKHDGRAEAFLLAVYGSLLLTPTNFGGTD